MTLLTQAPRLGVGSEVGSPAEKGQPPKAPITERQGIQADNTNVCGDLHYRVKMPDSSGLLGKTSVNRIIFTFHSLCTLQNDSF